MKITLIGQKPGGSIDHSVDLAWITGIPSTNLLEEVTVADRDTIILLMSGDHESPEELGAALDFMVDGHFHRVSSATALFIPRGTSYGQFKWDTVSKAHMVLKLALGMPYSEDRISSNLVVKKPVYEIWPESPAEGRMASSMTFLNSNLIPGCQVYLEYSWIYRMPEPNPHIMAHLHAEHDEIVMHIGSNPEDPVDLGASIEIGYQDDALMLDRTCALFVPKGTVHGPLVWKKVTRPHIEMGIVLGDGTLAGADPGGHQKADSEGGIKTA